MPVTQQSVTLTFQDPSGQPLANGRVDIRLQVDISAATSGGPQVCAGRLVSVTLNGSGSATVLLWPNSSTFPAHSVYFVTAFTALGQPAWKGELTV
jgi:hypothetical protein